MFSSKQVKALGLSFIFVCLFVSATAQEMPDTTGKISIPSPKTLIETNSVPLQHTTRTFRKAKFHGLQKRYESIDGIVMFGIVNNEKEVLLKGPEKWAPLGGAVQPNEDWAAAARRIAQEQTGNKIFIDAPVLIERMQFQLKNEKETSFSAFILHLRASPAADNWQPVDQASRKFKWFNKIPADAHSNHVQHIKLYLN